LLPRLIDCNPGKAVWVPTRPHASGKCPENVFSWSSSSTRLEKLSVLEPHVDGSAPDSKFLDNWRRSNRGKAPGLPHCSGIPPLNSLLWRNLHFRIQNGRGCDNQCAATPRPLSLRQSTINFPFCSCCRQIGQLTSSAARKIVPERPTLAAKPHGSDCPGLRRR
jgi:hypothetical protein